jgi:hypothetical protein
MRRLAKTVVAVLVLTGAASFLVPQPASAEDPGLISCAPGIVLGSGGVKVVVIDDQVETPCI